ncbi:MAG: ankyrin repeat domain-containing protein [Roseovarius sp.]
MRILILVLALVGVPAFACENSDAFFTSASDEELLVCIRENKGDFNISRDADQSGVLHKIVRFRRSSKLIGELYAKASTGEHWEKIKTFIDDDERTPLHYAAKYAVDPSVVSRLILYGFDPNALKDKVSYTLEANRGVTPLYYAAQRPDGASIVAALIAGGADQVWAEPEVAATPLMQAATVAEDGSVLAVLLADKEVSRTQRIGRGILELTDARGYTALNFAANHDRPFEVIRMLVEAGSEVDVANAQGFTPLLSAVAHSTDPRVVRYLFEKSEAPCVKTNEQEEEEIVNRDALELLLENSALSENLTLKTMFHEKCNEAQ